MDNQVYIIGEDHDKNRLESFVSQLSDKDFKISLFQTSQLNQDWKKILNIDKLIIALSPECDINLYDLSWHRLQNGKRSINLFLEPTQLTIEQKTKIGRNKALFKDLYYDNIINVLEKIINSEETWEPLTDLIVSSNLKYENQYDEEGNLILPIYDEPKKSKRGLIWGFIAAFCIMGFGIWGYSAYVESSKKAAEENLWNAWDEYLHTEAGSMVATLGETLRNENLEEFSQYGFENFIEDKIEPSKEISWSDMGPLMEGATISYTPPSNIKSIFTEDLLELYNKIENTSYNQEYWNPVLTIENSRYFMIYHVKMSENGKSGIISFVPFDHMDSECLADVSLCLVNGNWKINNFINKRGNYFSGLMNDYIAEMEKSKETLYTGNIYTLEGLIPISVKINYKSFPELSAIYENPGQNLEITMEGEFQDNNLGFYAKISENEGIGFDLKMEGDNILSGKLILYFKGEENIYYDVLLKSEENDGV